MSDARPVIGSSRRRRGGATALCVALAAASLHAEAAHAAGELVPLYTWYSTARDDYFSTTNPAWASSTPGELRSGYAFERVEGMVFSPSKPRPAGTRPLYLLYNDARGDNFTTADPAWSCTPGTTNSQGYYCASLEGYVHDRARAGTLSLDSFWNPSREDNAATTNPIWANRSSILEYDYYRTEGWIHRAPADQFPETPEVFGYGGEKFGKAPGKLPTGVRPLLVILYEFLDIQFHPTKEHFEDLYANPIGPSIVKFFSENSYGAFTWQPIVLGPLQFQKTFAQEKAEWTAGCGAWFWPCMYDELMALALQSGFDLAPYDTNGDGEIWPDELTVSIHEAHPNFYGQTDPFPSLVIADGKSFYVMPAKTPEVTTRSYIAHELGHALGLDANEHIYGSKGNSGSLSIMSASSGDPNYLVHFDPFNKIKFGWVKPRIARMDEPGGAIQLHAPQIGSAGLAQPLLLYDPRRGTREFWLLEFRSAAAGIHDADAANRTEGIAAWYVQIDSAGTPILVPGMIEAGGDGMLQTVVHPDDIGSDSNGDGIDDFIEMGVDDYLDSTPNPLDVVQWDPANWVFGSPPDVGFYGFRGQSTLFTPSHNPFQVRWLDRSVPAVQFRVRSPAGSQSRETVLEWSTLPGRLPPRVDELVPAAVSCGQSLVARGEIGVDGLVGYWLEGGGAAVAGSVQGTSATDRLVRVPWGLRRGTHQLGLRPASDDQARSNGLALTITSCDFDTDGADDRDDNCPTIANASQLDRGGVGTGSAPDGRGDACQCGDVNGDGRVTLADATVLLRSKLSPPTATLARPELCDVTGDAACSLGDAIALRRSLLSPPTAQLSTRCAPALPFVN